MKIFIYLLFFLFIKQASSEECLVNGNVINFGTSLCEEYNYKCARNCQNTKGAFFKELKSTTIQLIPLFLFVILIVWIVRKINIKRQNQREEEEKEDSINYVKRLLKEATEENNMLSMLSLAEEYYTGEILERNFVDALYWVIKAETLGSADAPVLRKRIENVASDIHKKSALEKLKMVNNSNDLSNKNINSGNVYIFTCSRWGGSIKVGKTNNLNRRLEEAQEEVKGTYSPRPPKVEIFFSQFSDNYSELETLVHSKLDAYRVEHSGKGREFFDIAPEEARRVIIEASKELE